MINLIIGNWNKSSTKNIENLRTAIKNLEKHVEKKCKLLFLEIEKKYKNSEFDIMALKPGCYY
jgi:hypothetical protein